MHLKLLVLGLGTATLSALAAPAAGPVQFRAHDIDPNFRGGYAVSVADFNKDGRLDVIANSLQVNEVAWYENPGESGQSWARHVIVPEMQSIVNQATADIDGDGIPEIAYQSHFAMQAAKSPGHNWVARSQGDPRKPWKAEKIDTFPTSHHVVWADLDGDGRKELLNAPLIGEKSLAPTYDQDKASLFWYDQKTWKRHLIADDIPGIIHRVRPMNWDSDKREEFLVASFEGIALYKGNGSGDAMTFQKTLLSPGHVEKAPRLGASDVGMGVQDGRKFLASVEPWHGNEVVVYNEVGGKWQRRVIFDKVTSGHEIAVVDLNGDGRSDVVANDNSRVTQQRPNATPGVHVFYAPDDPVKGEWKYQRIDDKSAMNSCVGADLNGDKRIDIVCTGAGGVTRWYENLGAGSARAPGAPPTSKADVDRWMTELSNWGRWGKEDQRGTLNLVTAERSRRAATLVKDGVSVSLSHTYIEQKADDATSPFGHEMLGIAGTGPFVSDRFTIMYHGYAHSHMDSLCHMSHEGRMYNGFPKSEIAPEGCTKLAISNFSQGIVTRGILMDIARLKGAKYLEPGTPITVAYLEAWEKRAGVKVGAGDIVLVRAGRWARRAEVGPWSTGRQAAGLHASVVPWLKARDVAMIGSDYTNDVLPSQIEGVSQPVHQLTLVALGMPLFDNLDLEAVADEAAKRKRWEFMLTVAPLVVDGATGSPLNPLAIF